MKPHPTEKMLEELLFSLDNDQLVLFAHLLGCEVCRTTLAELPPERKERYGPPEGKAVKTETRPPAELIDFPLDENGRPRPARRRRKGAARRSIRYR